MVIEKKKRNTFNNYETSIFILFCFLSFVLIVESKPTYELIKEATEAITEEFYDNDSVPAQTLKPNKLSRVITQWRTRPPTTYTIKFDSFTKLTKLVKDGSYESRPFIVDGLTWTFQIHPNGNKADNANGQISVYVKIDNSSFDDTTEVFAEIKFFVYNRIQDSYWTHHETDAVRFDSSNLVYGVPRLLAAPLFSLPANGYIFDEGQSVFGVDIFVAKNFTNWEVFKFVNNTQDAVFNWDVTEFSTRDLVYYRSGWFFIAGKSWDLQLYPQGNGVQEGKSISVYLLAGTGDTAYLRANLRVLDQIGSNDIVHQIDGWSNNGYGFDDFASLEYLNNQTNGFLDGDTLKIQLEILAVSQLDYPQLS